jgi:hypothetical protein
MNQAKSLGALAAVALLGANYQPPVIDGNGVHPRGRRVKLRRGKKRERNRNRLAMAKASRKRNRR